MLANFSAIHTVSQAKSASMTFATTNNLSNHSFQNFSGLLSDEYIFETQVVPPIRAAAPATSKLLLPTNWHAGTIDPALAVKRRCCGLECN